MLLLLLLKWSYWFLDALYELVSCLLGQANYFRFLNKSYPAMELFKDFIDFIGGVKFKSLILLISKWNNFSFWKKFLLKFILYY